MFYTLIAQCYDKTIVLVRTCDKDEAARVAWEYRDTYQRITLIESESGGLQFSVPVFDEVSFERITGFTEVEKACRRS